MDNRGIPFKIVNSAIRGITSLILKIDRDQLALVPTEGPLIIAVNHINFLDAPVLYTHLMPRPLTGLAKIETWDNWLLGYLFDMWGAIPLNRGEADTSAFRQALRALKAGQILAIAPEGTRSEHGRLQQGLPGAALIALKSKVPVLPVAIWGIEQYREKLSRLQRPDFRINVGSPFTVNTGGEKATSEVRGQVTDEIMYQIAALLPESYRGVYANLDTATIKYLQFEDSQVNNVLGN